METKKYKLINRTTKEEFICEKVTIDGYDYYVSDEKPKRKDCCITSTNSIYQDNQESLNNKVIFIDKEVINYHEIICRVVFYNNSVNLPFDISELKKVIATNNPNIDVPKVIDEVEELALIEVPENLQEDSGCNYPQQEWDISKQDRLMWVKGYNKSQETHPFSEDDIKSAFLSGLQIMHDNLIKRDWRGKQLNTPTIEEGEKSFEVWKSQQVKTIYYDK